MFIFQLTAKAENILYKKQPEQPKQINRNIKSTHVFSCTIEEANKKLDLAIKMHDWRIGAMDKASGITYQERISGQKSWDKDKCANLLEKMGYEDGEIEFQLLQSSDRFEKTLMDAHLVISKLEENCREIREFRKKTTDPTMINALDAMVENFELTANAAASAALKEEENYILWASQKWAKTSHKNITDIFYRLVDANSYLSHEGISALYNTQSEVKGKSEYIVQKPQADLEKYYSYICMPKSYMNKKGKEGKYGAIVENYSYNLEKFENHLEKSIENENSWFEYHKKIKEAPTSIEKICAAAAPFAEAATPVVAAISMLSPHTALLGYAYFTKAGVEALQRGDYWHASLIGLTTALPIFSEMAGLSTGALSTISKAGVVTSKGAGFIFQAEIGISTGMLLIDGSKYGLSLEQIQELETNLGFIMMPSMVRKGKTNLSQIVPKKTGKILPEKNIKKAGRLEMQLRQNEPTKTIEDAKKLESARVEKKQGGGAPIQQTARAGRYVQLKDNSIVRVVKESKVQGGSIEVIEHNGSRRSVRPRDIHSTLENYNNIRQMLDKAKSIPLNSEVICKHEDLQGHIKKHVLPGSDKTDGNRSISTKLDSEPNWWAELAGLAGMDAKKYYQAETRKLWKEAVSGQPGVYAFYERYHKEQNIMVVLKSVETGGERQLMVGVYNIGSMNVPGPQFVSLYLAPLNKLSLKHLKNVVPITFKSVEEGIYMDYNPFNGSYTNLEKFVNKNKGYFINK